jgi:exodeoxyribonuclease V gamma subunit
MAIKQYLGSNNQVLVSQLANVLSLEKSIFAPTFICIGHTSTKDWLIEELIKKLDVVGNCVFQKQHELIHMIHATLIENNSKKELYQSDHLQWFVYSILRTEAFQSAFPEISTYYGDDSLMQYTLAEKVTQLFLSYQESAIELLTSFDTETNGSLHFKWQQYIWKELQILTENKFASLPVVYREINESLKIKERQEYLVAKIPNIHVYGDLEFTPEFIKFLSEIATVTNVTIYRIDRSTNLNTSRFVKNNSSFIFKINHLFNGINAELIENNLPHSSKNLLKHVQAEIETGVQNSEYEYNPNEDDSIRIANCFTEYREVEALWNYLIHQFNTVENLALRDICVIVPSLEKYAPAIKAVFKNELVSLDYTFYDTNSNIQDSPYKALLALYDFESDEFTSKQVLSLLEFKYIREKFGFSEDLSIVKKAINDASIYHGFEGQKELETHYVSWKNGLKRLIIGACIEKTESLISGIGEDFYPVSEYEDQSRVELIRLNHFVDTLHRFSNERSKTRNLADWQVFIQKSIEEFINVTEYEPIVFDKKLEQLAKSSNVIPSELVDFKVILYNLHQLFENQELSERIGFGGIRFVSPNPRMVTSFKINCFLGLNGSDFPRSFKKLSFDLRKKEQVTTSNELDKHLFLSLIQGAKEKLYLSYIGQNVKDNSVIPASTLVEDLLDVTKKWGAHDKNMVIKHPLHAFSNKYNSEKFPELIRYDIVSNTTSELITEIKDSPKELLKRDVMGRIIIPLHELIRCIEDPVKHYYTKVLGIYYTDRSIDLSENELFDLDNLEQWNIKNSMLQGELAQGFNEKEMFQRLKMNGHFPLKNIGESVKKSSSFEAQKVIEEIHSKLKLAKREALKIYYTLNDKYVIEGNIDTLFDDTFLFATVSSDKWKYQLRAAIQLFTVIISSDNRITKGYYFSKNKTKGLKCTSEDATKYLVQLCAKYEEATTELNHFFIDFGGKLTTVFEKENTPEQFVASLKDIINDEHLYVNPSEYFMRELNNGSITNQQTMDCFKSYYQLINEIFTTIFIEL